MAKSSNKQLTEIILASRHKDNDAELDRKITLAIEGFTTTKSPLS